MMVQYTTAESLQDLQQILELQAQNLPQSVDEQEMKSQGFVTVKHELSLLSEMNKDYQHIIAKANDKVAGFALVMLKKFANKIPVLVPMFELIDQLQYQGKPLKEYSYFVMGQICIDKEYRGQGIFQGLYTAMREQMSLHFDLVVTEIATRNERSLKAHSRVGFSSLTRYVADDEEWDIVVWDWQ